MIGIDTNILVRFIVNDDEKQFEIAKDLILAYEGKKHTMFINDIVFCEVSWVLKMGYHYSRQEIYNVINAILSMEEFCFASQQLLIEAITLYKNTLADFSDCFIYVRNRAASCTKTYSFDKKGIIGGIFTPVGNV